MDDVVRSRLPNISLFILGFALIAIFWWSTVAHMASLIWNVDVFAHGQLVPFVSLAMIWSRREGLLQSSTFFPPAALLLFGSAMVWFIGQFLDAALLTHLALITAIQGLLLLSFGRTVYMRLLFPMLFLYMMVPFGYAVIQPLQYLTAEFVIDLLELFGVPHTADGVLIELSSGLYEVAEACAGVKFLFTSLVTGVLLANIVFDSWKRRAFILTVSLILPIIANVVRVLTILLIAEATDQSFAKDVDHIVYGWVFLSIVLFALISFAYWISDKNDQESPSLNRAVSDRFGEQLSYLQRAIIGLGLIAVPAVGVMAGPAQPIVVRDHITEPDPFSSAPPAGFRLLERASALPKPFVTGVDTLKAAYFRSTSNVFSVFLGSIDILRQGQRVYQPGFRPVDGDWEDIQGRGGMVDAECGLKAREIWFSDRGRIAVVWVVRLVADESVSSSLDEKLKVLGSQFYGKTLSGNIIIISGQITNSTSDSGAVDEIRQSFNALLSFALKDAGKSICAA